MLRSQPPLFARTDLLNAVTANPNIRIILISAPAGYGKTVLATQIAQFLGKQFVNHRVTVWQRDISALHKTAVNALGKVNGLNQLDSVNYSEHSAVNLMQVLEQYESGITYIIDDIQHLVDFQKAEQWLQNLLDNLPHNVTLILCGRQLPPLNWVPFVHRDEILAFGIERLSLSVDELLASLRDITAIEAERLVRQFDGWIAGIKLALTIPEDKALGNVNSLEPQQLFNDLLVSTFQDQAPDFQTFLMLSSSLDAVSEYACREILGLQHVAHHLNRLHAQQLFIDTGDNGTEYHDLFREFLQARLKHYDTALYLQTHRQIAEWYHSQDHIENAILHYVEAECFKDAAELAAYIAHSYLVEGQKEALLHFYGLLQENSLPELLLYCGIIYMERREFALSQTLLKKAHNHFIEQGDDAKALRASIELAFNDYRAGHYTASLERLEGLEIPYPDMQARRCRLQGLACLETGQFELAIEYLTEALDALSVYESDFGRSNLLQDLSEAYLRAGDFAQAGTALKDAVALKRKLANADDLALALNNLGHYWYRVAAYDDAIVTLEDGLDIVSSTKARATAYLYWSLADVYRALGLFAEAERYYNTARKIAGNEEYLYVGIMLSFAMMRCSQAYWHDAHHILNHIMQRTNTSIQSLMLTVLKSAVQTMIGQVEYEELDAAIVELQTRGARLKLADALGIYLLVGWQSGQPDLLERGVRILKSLDTNLWSTVASFVVNFPQLENYLVNNMGISTLQSYCTRLRSYKGDAATSIYSPTDYNLSIYALGQDYFELNGNRVTDWTVAFARELFLYLYLHGRKPRYALQEEFWPNRDIEQAMASFHTTRNRIRKALGEQGIIYEDQHYIINQDFDIKADCVQFEDYVRRSHRLPLTDARCEDLLNRALKLYQGDFLPQVNSDWVIHKRQYYQGLFVDALVRLAEIYELRADYIAAIRMYEQAVAIELYTEKLYRQLILCWGRIGRRDMMKITYEKLSQRLHDGLQMEPSSQTNHFYQSLINDTEA